MLARRSRITASIGTIDTPLLLPSFSSKGFPELINIMKLMSGFITGSVLISAYDFHYSRPKLSSQKLSFAEVIFLDSGGYEARVEHDFSEAYGTTHNPHRWNENFYRRVLNNWPGNLRTIAVTYDGPKMFLRLKEQIKRAATLQKDFPDLRFEFLIKPETSRELFLNIDSIIRYVHEFGKFAAIGLVDKELGPCILDRMVKIARLRSAMNDARIETPIHVFGSLDTVNTPLYFCSGAEIFDGLTWLRFGYHQSQTLYNQNYNLIHDQDGILKKGTELAHRMWVNNYYYLENLKHQMINFIQNQDFNIFGDLGPFLEQACKKLEARLS